MRPRDALLMLTLTLGLVASRAGATTTAPPGDSFVLPESLRAMLEARGDDGAPIVGAEEHDRFDALPDRGKGLTAKAVADGMVTSPRQLAEILALGLSNEKFELVMQDNCILCHSNPDFQQSGALFSNDPAASGLPTYMNLKQVLGDVHVRYGLSCAGCHGGDPGGWMAHDFPDSWPTDGVRRKKDRSWIPLFCSRCHSDAAFMRRFNPALPTDQLLKYRTSKHGELLLKEDDSRAAQCVSCHGVHGIRDAKSPLSKVYRKRIPETCGACHADPKVMAGLTLADGSPIPTDQLEQYKSSVHWLAVERGDMGAAVCNDCHGNHAAMPPGVASVAEICRTCHAGNGTLFDGSKHKAVFERHRWPECGTCHGKHAIAKTSDAMLGVGEGSVCVACHAQYAKGNPECDRTAVYFHDTITQLAGDFDRFENRAEALAERGLDVETLDDQLQQLSDFVKQSRSYIHSFDRSDFRQVADPAQATVRRIAGLVEKAEGEYRARRMGLLVSVLLIGSLGLALYIKLRRFERDQSR